MLNLLNTIRLGGPFITVPIMIIIVASVIIFIKALKNNNFDNTISLLKSLGWLSIAIGYLGRTIGLIMAFDKIAASGDLTPSLLADGIRIAILTPFFGIAAFIIARIFVIVLIMKRKDLNVIINK